MSIPVDCIICYEQINYNYNITFANCNHANCIHAECILQWTHTCPVCRANIYDNNHTTYDIQNAININIDINQLNLIIN